MIIERPDHNVFDGDLVRPKLMPLQIFGLPDELLIRAFEYVRGHTGIYGLHFFDFGSGNVSGIKNVRLTCRRFCELSSHLLLYYISVRLTRQSLAHLDEVSRHPSVSKGVRAIKLSLGPFYDSVLAGDIRIFAAYRASKLRDCIEAWERALEWQMPSDVNSGEIYQGAITRAIPLAESWEEAADEGINTTCADHLIAGAHAQYCQHYGDHKSICDSLAQAIASAMKRMPTATWVKIDDQNMYDHDSMMAGFFRPKDLDEPDSLLERLLSPLNWQDAREHGLGPPPFNLIGDLLLSLHKFGIPLKGLDIDTPPPTSGLSNTPSTHKETGLRSAVQQLKAIEFRPRTNIWDVYWTERAADEWNPFTRFLSCLLHTNSLQKIDLSFYFMGHDDPPPLLSMAPILLSYTWPNLEILHFNGPFHLKELQAIVQCLEKNVELQWSGYLISGSWAEVLDLLKEHGPRWPEVGDINGSVYGQECDDMTREERDIVFKGDTLGYLGSKATQYIRGLRWQKSNPVRDWEIATRPPVEDE